MQDSSEAIKKRRKRNQAIQAETDLADDATYLGCWNLIELGLSLVGEKAINRISFRLHGNLKVHIKFRVAFQIRVNRESDTCPGGEIGTRVWLRTKILRVRVPPGVQRHLFFEMTRNAQVKDTRNVWSRTRRKMRSGDFPALQEESRTWECCSDGGWALDCKSSTRKHSGFESNHSHNQF